MKLFAKTIGVVLALVGIAISYFTVNLCFDNLNSLPRLLMPVQEAIDTANLLMNLYFNGYEPFAEIEACKSVTLEKAQARLAKIKDEYSALSVIVPVE